MNLLHSCYILLTYFQFDYEFIRFFIGLETILIFRVILMTELDTTILETKFIINSLVTHY
jgi:hypothetical protein